MTLNIKSAESNDLRIIICLRKSGPKVMKLFSCSTQRAEHGILNAHKYENIKKFNIFHAHISLELCYFFLLINV